MRDITLEDTVREPFTTRAFATGLPTTLAGTPVLSVLEENNATPITAGVSVSVDRASVAGLNEYTVVATAANGYEVGKSYGVYISTGTVGGGSAVGEVVGGFTIEADAAFTRLGAPDGASVSADNAAIKSDTAGISAIPTTAMRGTDSALLAANTPTNFGDMAITVTTGEVTAGNMRGTDGANTTAPDNTGIAAIQAVTDVIPNNGAMTSIAQATNLAVIDTNVDAIKVQTDKFTFTVAGQVDSNTQYVNDQIITGDGGVGTEFKGA